MFRIGDKVTTKNYGVCVIQDIVEKFFADEKKTYFVLDNLYNNPLRKSIKIYILVDKAEEQMRHVLSKKDILELIDSFNEIQELKIPEFRHRRNVFEELYKSGDIKLHCQLIKSLYLLDMEFKAKSKTLPFKDKEYFDKLKATVYDEFAYVLDILPSEVEDFIKEKLAKNAYEN